MENMKRGENRKEHPHNNIPRKPGRKDNEAPKGFEGMNYEQKRRPYNKIDRSDKDWDRNIDNDSKSGRRLDDPGN